MIITGLFYGKNASRSVLRDIHTIVPTDGSTATRFPVFENLMGSEVVTQECVVTISDAGGERKFLVAAQYEPEAHFNAALREVVFTYWRGSVTVVKMGTRVSFTGLTDRWDRSFDEFAVRR